MVDGILERLGEAWVSFGDHFYKLLFPDASIEIPTIVLQQLLQILKLVTTNTILPLIN